MQSIYFPFYGGEAITMEIGWSAVSTDSSHPEASYIRNKAVNWNH